MTINKTKILSVLKTYKLHDNGVHISAIAMQQKITYKTVKDRLRKRAEDSVGMAIIDNLTVEEINSAITKYQGAKLCKELIDGIELNLIQTQYFELRYIDDEDGKLRNQSLNKTNNKRNKRLKGAREQARAQATTEIKTPAIMTKNLSEWGMFEDYSQLNKLQPAGVVLSCKNDNLSYGCAAAMCSEQ